MDTADGVRVFQARRGILVNTGTEPKVPPIPGLADTPYWTNREAIETEQVPQSLIVLGGGAVGTELAQVFARFGAQVTVVEALPRLLPADEPEAGDLLATVFEREASRCASAHGPSGSATTAGVSPSPSPVATCSPGSACWSPPAAAPTIIAAGE